jgi:hypothetical protein
LYPRLRIPGRYNRLRSSVDTNAKAQVQQFAVIVKPNPQDGGFIATVAGHPHIVGQGETEEAALEDARMDLESKPEAGDGVEDLGGTPHPFDSRLDLEALASEQGVEPADDFDALLGDFWPEDESVDEFVATLREWRRDAPGA